MSQTVATFATIFFSMILVNNYVLVQFLGICPFLGVSKKLDSSVVERSTRWRTPQNSSMATTGVCCHYCHELYGLWRSGRKHHRRTDVRGRNR